MNIGANRTLSVFLAVLLTLCAVSRADVYYVAQDGDNTTGQSWAAAFTSIQGALGSASVLAGDELRVKQGTYAIASSISVGKAVIINGGYSGAGETRDPQTYATIIDGGGSVIHCFNVGADAVFDGLTITGGYSTGTIPNDEGGGMYIDNCNPTINNCTFVGNYAEYRGGAIAMHACDDVVISNSTFSQNVTGSQGGAIYSYDSVLAVTGCTFSENEGGPGSSTSGGGLYCNISAPTITDCTFTGNRATKGAGILTATSDAVITGCTFADCNATSNNGGGIYTYKSSPMITDCLFSGNHVVSSGGAIYDGGGADPGDVYESTIVNCIMIDNHANVYGGAVYSDRYLTSKFTNCTIYGNNADNKGGGVFNGYGEPTFTNCIIWGNTAPTGPSLYNFTTSAGFQIFANYSDIEGGYAGTDNLDIEPNFVDAGGGDFHLTADSNCVDTGDNAAPGITAADYEGNSRPFDGDLDGTDTVDMGAYEYQGAGPIADHVDWIELFQGQLYENPSDMTAGYAFLLYVETDDTVDHVEFLTPGGYAYAIPSDPYTASGDVETYHEDWGSTHGWEYWGLFDTGADLADYGDGTYTVTIHYKDASVQQTDLWYGVPGTSDPVPQPTQKPNLTSPTYEAQIASPVTFEWDACTDPNAGSIFLDVIDEATDTDVVDVDIDLSATNSDAYSMDEGEYEVEFAFETFYDVSNADGIQFEYGKVSLVESAFEVLYARVYRFWAPAAGRHFYTASEREKNKLIDNYSHFWTYEGPVMKACATDYYPNLAQVYRFWSDSSSAHFYTLKESEKDKLINQYSHIWTYEGPVLYAYPAGAQPGDAKPVYRFWKGADNTHFYTMKESEKDKLIASFSHIYTFEGTAFYAYE